MVDGSPDPIFEVIEIEVNSRCNRRCSYCPVSLEPNPPVPVRMPDEVFERVSESLAEIQFAGRISYHFYNEPLLRNDLERLVTQLYRSTPSAFQVLYTNGDRLTDGRHKSLLRAGIDAFIVTQHDNDADTGNRALVWSQAGSSLDLTNRGGRLEYLPVATTKMRNTPCFAPSEIIIVTAAGDVVLCYEDSERSEVMGNVLHESLADIWRSPKFTSIRRQLAEGHRKEGPAICGKCTNVAHASLGSALIDEPFRVNGSPLEVSAIRATAARLRLEIADASP